MSKILLVCGESGSGKTIITALCERLYNLKSIESYTTRTKREPNERGHIFVNDAEFNDIMENNNIAAYTDYHDHRYCVTEKQVEENDIYVIDLDGIKYFKTHYKGNKTPVIIYINSPENVRKVRMYKQGRSAADVESRIAKDRIAFTNAKDTADFIIDNGNSDDAAALAKKLWIKFME